MDCEDIISTDVIDLNESIYITEPEFEILGNDFKVFPDQTLSSDNYEFDHLYLQYPNKFSNKSNLVELLRYLNSSNGILDINRKVYLPPTNNLLQYNQTIESRLIYNSEVVKSYDSVVVSPSTSIENARESEFIDHSNLNSYEEFKSGINSNNSNASEGKISLNNSETKSQPQIEKDSFKSNIKFRNKKSFECSLISNQSNSKSSLNNVKTSADLSSNESLISNRTSDNGSADIKSKSSDKSSNTSNKRILQFKPLKSQNKVNQTSRLAVSKTKPQFVQSTMNLKQTDTLNATFDNGEVNTRTKRRSLIMNKLVTSKTQQNNSCSDNADNKPTRPSSLFQKPKVPETSSSTNKMSFKSAYKSEDHKKSTPLHLPVQSPLTPTVSVKSTQLINSMDKIDEQNNNISQDITQLSINSDSHQSEDNPLNRTYDAEEFEALKSTNFDTINNNDSGDSTPTNDDIAEQENRYSFQKPSIKPSGIPSFGSKRTIPKPNAVSRLPTTTIKLANPTSRSRIAQMTPSSRGLIKPKVYTARKN